jgi:hypothetical protein
MTVMTIGEVIALAKSAPISGLTGIVKHVFDPKESELGETSQGVVIVDGPHEVIVSIKDPETHGGVVPQSVKGRKLYFLPGDSLKGKPCGLRRGGDYDKRSGTGKNHYVNLDKEASWSLSDEKVVAAPVQTAGSFEEDEIPMSFGKPAPAAAPEPVPPQPVGAFEKYTGVAEPKAPAPAPTGNLDTRFAALVLRHRQCVDAANDTARAVNSEIGQIGGESLSTSDIVAIANCLFSNATAQGLWK